MERTIEMNETRELADDELDAVSGGAIWFNGFGKYGVAANAYQSGSSATEVLYWLLVP